MPYITKRRVIPQIKDKEATTRHNNKWSKYYHNKQWKLLREWYISSHPLCEVCLFKGRSVPAEEVHHRIPFSQGETMEEKYELLLDPDNLQSVCRKCHMDIHNHKV